MFCACWVTQQTRDAEPMVTRCWAWLADDGPTLSHDWVNDWCLLGGAVACMSIQDNYSGNIIYSHAKNKFVYSFMSSNGVNREIIFSCIRYDMNESSMLKNVMTSAIGSCAGCWPVIAMLTRLNTKPLQRWNIFVKIMDSKGFFQFEIIINVLASSFRFIWIPMLWVYAHFNFLILSVWGSY